MGIASDGKDASRLISAGSLCGFAVRVVILFSVLIAGWTIFGPGYAALFRAAGNALFAGQPERTVIFSPAPGSQGIHDTEMVVIDPVLRSKSTTALSSRRHGFMPMALFVSMIVASPIAWRKRALATLVGLVFISTYVIIKLALFPAAYGPGQSLAASQNQETGLSVLSKFFWVVSASSAGWAIIPTAIWMLFVFRDWGPAARAQRDPV